MNERIAADIAKQVKEIAEGPDPVVCIDPGERRHGFTICEHNRREGKTRKKPDVVIVGTGGMGMVGMLERRKLLMALEEAGTGIIYMDLESTAMFPDNDPVPTMDIHLPIVHPIQLRVLDVLEDPNPMHDVIAIAKQYSERAEPEDPTLTKLRNWMKTVECRMYHDAPTHLVFKRGYELNFHPKHKWHDPHKFNKGKHPMNDKWRRHLNGKSRSRRGERHANKRSSEDLHN